MIDRRRRSLLLVATLGLACLALVLAHSAPMAHEMSGEMQDGGDHASQAVVSICLAVISLGAAVLGAAAAVGVVRIRRHRPPRELRPTTAHGPGRPAFLRPASRAGPASLQVFLR